MNDLTETPNQKIAKTVSAECSPELWRLLTAPSHGHFEAVELIAHHSWAPTEIRAVADRLEAHMAPCSKEAIIETLAPLVAVYGVPDRSKGEWSAFWRFYIDALSDLPIECLRAGVAAYVNRSNSEFFPKPGPLRDLCLEKARPLFTAIGRVRSVLRRSA